MVLSLSATQNPAAAIHTFEVEWAVQETCRVNRTRWIRNEEISASRGGMQKLLKLNRRKPLVSLSPYSSPVFSVSAHTFPVFVGERVGQPFSFSFGWQVEHVYKINGKSRLLRLLFRSRYKPLKLSLF